MVLWIMLILFPCSTQHFHPSLLLGFDVWPICRQLVGVTLVCKNKSIGSLELFFRNFDINILHLSFGHIFTSPTWRYCTINNSKQRREYIISANTFTTSEDMRIYRLSHFLLSVPPTIKTRTDKWILLRCAILWRYVGHITSIDNQYKQANLRSPLCHGNNQEFLGHAGVGGNPEIHL